jgi:hypothetical protein
MSNYVSKKVLKFQKNVQNFLYKCYRVVLNFYSPGDRRISSKLVENFPFLQLSKTWNLNPSKATVH